MAANDHRTVLRQLANLVVQMRPLAERVASDEFSPTERKKLRELTGDGEVFHLSNALNLFCGETSRDLRLAGKRSATWDELMELRKKRNANF